ncbi:hypothetical protein ACR777_20790 [Sphingobacterium spiritivorum]|uniref:hypothetical protein n=1 Tax=Sphingobacterium spiritivorum TaxID=258 RepID=UPI003DA3EF7F
MSTTQQGKTNPNPLQEYSLSVMQEVRTEMDQHLIIGPDTTSSANATPVNKFKKDVKNYIPPKITAVRIEMENGIAAGSATALPANTNKPVDETWDNQDMTSDSPIYW